MEKLRNLPTVLDLIVREGVNELALYVRFKPE